MGGVVLGASLPLTAYARFGWQSHVLNTESFIIWTLGVCLCASMVLVARNEQVSDRGAIRFGMLYVVLACFVIGMFPLRTLGALGIGPPALTLSHAVVVLFALFVPMAPWRSFLVALAAAATQPLSLLLFAPFGAPPPVIVSSVVLAGVAVAMATLCGRIAYGLMASATRVEELGAYHLNAPVRRDATGELWRASHRLLARPATVKAFRPSLLEGSSGEALRRFEQEAEAAATLTSPHTFTLYDYGVSDDGCLYYAMEPIDGEDLGSLVARLGPCPYEVAVEFAAELCDSLSEAHAAGLVHGALEPKNVYSCQAGRSAHFIKVGFLAEPGDLREGRHRGPRREPPSVHAAPEVVTGAPATERSDIYQVGALLHFLTTGQRPDGAASLAARSPHPIPSAFEQLVARCLARDPNGRFPSASALGTQLRELVPSGRASPAWDPVASTLPELSLPAAPATSLAAPTALPEVLEAARRRLGQFGALALACTIAANVASIVVNDLVNRPTVLAHVLPFAVASVLADVTLVVLTRDRKVSTPNVMNAAIGYFVLRCALLALGTTDVNLALGLDLPRYSLSPMLLIMFPLLVPLRPRQLLIPGILCAAVHPLVAAFMYPVETPPAWPDALIHSAYALVASLWVARVTTGLRGAASDVKAFGAYRLTELIGRGGMGEVWRAEHDLLARPAAVKVVRPDAALIGEGSQRRFEREARITAFLTSPHTVTLYDYGISPGGSIYYVMELLDGEDLERYVREHGPLTPEETVEVALQVCDSLAEAHARGLVHRDLKPANIFLARVGGARHFVKVLDFGLAELTRRLRFDMSSLISELATTRIAGTPAYMSPEMLLGLSVDARADLYQLGCIMYFLLTGQVIFEGSPVAMALAHVNETAPRVSIQSAQSIPQELDAIVARCLEKVPQDRFASAEELEAALRAVRLEDSERNRQTDSLPPHVPDRGVELSVL